MAYSGEWDFDLIRSHERIDLLHRSAQGKTVIEEYLSNQWNGEDWPDADRVGSILSRVQVQFEALTDEVEDALDAFQEACDFDPDIVEEVIAKFLMPTTNFVSAETVAFVRQHATQGDDFWLRTRFHGVLARLEPFHLRWEDNEVV